MLPCWLTVEDGWVRTLAVETALQLDADHPDFDEFAVADLMREASALQEKGGYHACQLIPAGIARS